eukprot:m.546865 g.546865  ORF g.546865 m.546865 type:complete len:55 (-) comp57693_c0_seq6:692-856(-)
MMSPAKSVQFVKGKFVKPAPVPAPRPTTTAAPSGFAATWNTFTTASYFHQSASK